MRERPTVFSEGTCSPQSCLPRFPCLTPVRKISREKGAFSPHWWIAVNNASQGTVSRLMTISRALAKVWNPISTVLSEHYTDFYPFPLQDANQTPFSSPVPGSGYAVTGHTLTFHRRTRLQGLNSRALNERLTVGARVGPPKYL